MPFRILRNDITKVEADAIVNTANPRPVIGGGTDNAIYTAAGRLKLLKEREKIGDIMPGNAFETPAFNLKAKYIIHTVGPVWQGGNNNEEEILRNCYRNSLKKAAELGCESIAFPLIATGVYGFPKDLALQIAMNEIMTFLMNDDTDMEVMIVVYDEKAVRLSKNLFFMVEEFIDDESVIESYKREYGIDEEEMVRYNRKYQRELYEEYYAPNSPYSRRGDRNIPKEKEYISVSKLTRETLNKEEFAPGKYEDYAFRSYLLGLIEEKGLSNKEVYKRSNVSSKSFSKIINGATKVPQKETVFGFCMGLMLNEQEARDLLASAGYAFNPLKQMDKFMLHCIRMRQYNVMEINIMLYELKLPPIGNDNTKG